MILRSVWLAYPVAKADGVRLTVCSLFQASWIPVVLLQLNYNLSDDAFSTVLAVQIDRLRILRLRSTIGRGVTRCF